MDKLQKHDFMNSIEQYLEQNQVYEIFEDLMKRLIVSRPEKPLDFIQEALSAPKTRRVFVMGPPGANRHEISLGLAEYFSWRYISTGDLLRKEVEKKSEEGKRIDECQKVFKLVDDEIVIKLVKAEVDKCESSNDSYFIQGFPRTKVQALSLQKLRIVPDKFIHLNVRQNQSLTYMQKKIGENSKLYGSELIETSVEKYAEYTMNINAVRDSFKQFIFEYDADRPISETQQDLFRMLKLRYRNGAPRRPPRVIIIGPPGSGRTTQSKCLADTYGIVHVSPQELVKVEAEKNPGIKIKIKDALEAGEPIPDEIMLRLIDQRLRMSDCRVNGWVLDGFPQTETQINLLRSMRIKPSLVVLFEQAQDESIRRLSNRRLDPRSGTLYNVEIDPPKSENVSNALVKKQEDSEPIVRKRYQAFNQNISLLEEAFKNVLLATASDKTVDAVREQIQEAAENPVF